jgi:hypothetical protein
VSTYIPFPSWLDYTLWILKKKELVVKIKSWKNLICR